MSFKVGDQILLRATITDINEDAIYPYCVNIELGENWITNDFSCDSSAIVTVKNKGALEKCSCLHEEYGKKVCYGTKEREECSCEGNPTKCNFYQSVKNNIKEDVHVVTVEEYRTALREIYELNYCHILKMFAIPEYSGVTDKESAIIEIVLGFDPADVVGAYEDYKNEHTINVGDVIILNPENKGFLVTKIDKGSYSLIAKDGQATNITFQNLTNTIPKDRFDKIKSGVTIREFFYD